MRARLQQELLRRPAARALRWGYSLDAANNYYYHADHTGLDGRTFDVRIRDAGYAGTALAENVGAGHGSAAAVVESWMGSPGHCRNIITASYRSIGVASAYSATAAYGSYWTMNLGDL